MPLLHAIVLGIVQGLTEFLPISSSGHLLIVPWFFDWNDLADASVKKAFDVALHIGTLAAVLGYFRRDLLTYGRAGIADGWGFVRGRRETWSADGRIAGVLVLASVPAAAVGAFFENWIDDTLGTPTIIAASLIGFGMVLAWSDRRSGSQSLDSMTWRQAGLIGAAQVLALNPGTSRSGITISAGRFLGLDRWSAARFSFLLSVPITAGAALVKVGGLAADGIPDGLLVPMIVGVLTSAVAGWLAVAGLLRLIRTSTFTVFVVYRVLLGAVILTVVAAGWRS
ncbi:MAG: undecaprenyl-diphosphate phosphatase [Actinomycetota bacterium]